ncbi:MAG TPA: hypothetical protein VNO74_10910, partial [Methylomirabilota bacterium]|nr:hypothetical protein [Methylomirabilota bacterium]
PILPHQRKFLRLGVTASFDQMSKLTSMKARHAAALALVGWYLMVPPIANNGRVDADVPLLRWWKFEKLDSAQECETILLEMQQPPPTEEDRRSSSRAALELRHTPTFNREEFEKRLSKLLCIEESDSSVTGN